MRILLQDNGRHLNFAPLTLTRPVGNLRLGILTNDERWKLLLPDTEIFFETEDYLSDKFQPASGAIRVNACIIPDQELANTIAKLKGSEKLSYEELPIASIGNGEVLVKYKGKAPLVIKERWDLYRLNGEVLANDFELISKGRTSVQLSSTNTIIGDTSNIFVEEGARVEAAILNTTNGPIYIGKNAEIMEGSIVRGPFAMGESSVLKMGAKIYGPTTLGPYCKVGGEVNNVIFQAYSNKGHDGFLGNSLIGEWCNIGADTNTSNLKNNYGDVKTYSYKTGKLEQTDVQFMGLTMGDHSKCGINTMFNTASVVGVCSNIFSSAFPPKMIPSFSWGVDGSRYNFDKAVEGINNMMSRRNMSLSKADKAILRHISDKK